ncbi:MAG: hypothetical protein LBB39_02665 [Mycoplasmataceae bacterium]|jgi:hypothetical protein|nr:hypothetical protein [Mycoplasmataceae bacterium]
MQKIFKLLFKRYFYIIAFDILYLSVFLVTVNERMENRNNSVRARKNFAQEAKSLSSGINDDKVVVN